LLIILKRVFTSKVKQQRLGIMISASQKNADLCPRPEPAAAHTRYKKLSACDEHYQKLQCFAMFEIAQKPSFTV
jgi:hypothetical protein